MITDSEPTRTAHLGPSVGEPVPLYSAAFAADPHRVYRDLRNRFGSLAPVELAPGVPATLVIGYRTAVRILNDPERFPADPRPWDENIPSGCPIGPMMIWRPNAIRSAGTAHARYRSAISGALDRVDLHRLRATVGQIAIPLINSFCGAGACDVLTQYALPVVVGTLNAMLGCPPEITQRVATGMAAIFDTVDAEKGNQELGEALVQLTAIKRNEPGADVTSWLIEHPAALKDDEMLHQLVLLWAAGIEPSANLIVNTLLLMLTSERFAGHLLDGSLSTRDALDEVLFNDPPLANYCISYPRHPVLIDGIRLPAHQPVLISISACNNDPEIRGADVTQNRSHLAFSTGPHACPAQTAVLLIVQEAVDQLLDALPELALAQPPEGLEHRPGPFHRALKSLPVTFPQSPPIPLGDR